jgi:transcriptional regulator with XRE-family HTH domain
MTGIGPRLRQERHRLKLSQSAMGTLGGVETNAQGNYESGARYPKADYLLRLIDAGVDITYVMTGTRSPDVGPFTSVTSPSSPVVDEHLGKVTHQLHRNLHGLIDALYQMALLIESRANDTADEAVKMELDTIRTEAQTLAEASVRLIFVTSKLS